MILSIYVQQLSHFLYSQCIVVETKQSLNLHYTSNTWRKSILIKKLMQESSFAVFAKNAITSMTALSYTQ